MSKIGGVVRSPVCQFAVTAIVADAVSRPTCAVTVTVAVPAPCRTTVTMPVNVPPGTFVPLGCAIAVTFTTLVSLLTAFISTAVCAVTFPGKDTVTVLKVGCAVFSVSVCGFTLTPVKGSLQTGCRLPSACS